MASILDVAMTWIRSEYGGRASLPTIGLRSLFRFQRNVGKAEEISWDVQVLSIQTDDSCWRGTAQLAFSEGATPNLELMKEGELIELREAYNVIGVGRIIRFRR